MVQLNINNKKLKDMTLHQLAKSIVASLWHNSIEELRFDGIDKNYKIKPCVRNISNVAHFVP